MATYTLSFTGAQVNAAIGNATNLFSTAHTWTGVQTIQGPTIASPNITGTTYQSTTIFDDDVTLQGGTLYAGSIEAGGNILFDGDVSCNSTLTVSSIASFTCEGTAEFNNTVQFNDDVDLAADLAVGGELIASITASDDLDMDGYNIENATRIAANSAYELGNGKVYLQFSGAGIASATYAGCYIDASGITPFAQGGAIPANVLVIYINA